MKPNKKNLLLDLGGVLVGADHSRAVEAFSVLAGAEAKHIRREIYESGLVARLELGEISPFEFRGAVCGALELKIPSDTFDKTWCKALYKLENVESLLFQMKAGFNFFVLSNTNPIHFEAIRSICSSWLGLIEGFHLSCDVGLKKPSGEYFNLAMSRFSLDPKNCVFLDDDRDNVLGAEAIGIRAHKVGDRGITEKELRSWGLI